MRAAMVVGILKAEFLNYCVSTESLLYTTIDFDEFG